MMFTTELLYKNSVGVPTFPQARGGQKALFIVNVVTLEGTFPVMGIDIEHKNLSDGSYTTAASFDSISTTGVFKKEASGLKQQVRLKLTLSAGTASRVAILDPQWSN
jgi:hypothetical protein